MQNSLKRQDYLVLHHIMDQAHKKYIKQSRINKQPAFNILRVLTTFKEIFPSTPEKLYKLIMLITKKYNPQTLQQWRKAIEKINSIEIKNSLNTSQFTKNQIQESRANKSKNQQNSIKTYKEQLDSEIDYIESKRSRLKFLAGDYRITQPSWLGTQENNQENKQNIFNFSNQNSLKNSQYAHYISFQPNQYTKSKQNSQKMKGFNQNSLKNSFSQNNFYSNPYLYHQNIPNSSVDFHRTQKLELPKKINPYHQISKIDHLSLIQDRIPNSNDDQEPSSKDQAKTLYSQNYQTQSNSRLHILPSKTHRDQYSINHIVNKSSQLLNKSLLTQTQKMRDLLQYQDFNMTLEEWQSLNERTTTFYEFNLKLKAFSAILANYQAFEDDRMLKSKAKIFNSTYLESKVLIALKQNIIIQQQNREKWNRAVQFNQNSLIEKSWKILNVLKSLKIYQSKNQFEVSKMNKSNYEFLLSFMFEQKQSQSQSLPSFKNNIFQQNSKSLTQSFQFQKRAEHFSNTQNFQNVWTIYKYFGLNIQMTKQQLEIFFNQYHKCLQRTVFKVLKDNLKSKKHHFLKIHDNRLFQKAFTIWITNYTLVKQQNQALAKAQIFHQKKIMQRVYKILLSIVYSTKIFSKRQEFIESKREALLKKVVLKKWVQEYKRKQQEKQDKKIKLSKLCRLINRLIIKFGFQSIQHNSQNINEKMICCQKNWQINLLKKVFTHFSKLLKNKYKYIQVCERGEKQFKRRILSKWKNLMLTKNAICSIQNNIKRMILRKLFVPQLKRLLRQYLLNQEQQRNVVKECFNELKKHHQQGKQKRSAAENQLTKIVKNNHRRNLIKFLKLNLIQSINQRKNRQIQNKINTLNQSLKVLHKKKLFLKISEIHALKMQQQSLNKQTAKLIKQNSLLIMLRTVQQQRSRQQNSKKLSHFIKLNSFTDFYHQNKKILFQQKQDQLIKRTNIKYFTSFVKNISLNYNKLKEQQNVSKIHFATKIQQKVLYSLAKHFVDITEKSNQLEDILNKKRKVEGLLIMKKKARKQTECRKKLLIIQKRAVFSQLKLNLTFKQKQKHLSSLINDQRLTYLKQSLFNQVYANQAQKQIQQKQRVLQQNIFWSRFNSYFIYSLLQKKHTFMGYKFRALKLQQITFMKWRQLLWGKKKRVSIQQQEQLK